MKGIGKYVLIALIAFALGAFASSKWFDNREPKVIVERDTVIVKEIDSTGFIIATQEKVEVANTTISLPSGTTLPSGEIITEPIEVPTQKYTGKEEMENGTVEFEIYADNLLGYNFTLTTEKEIITETITKTLPSRSRLFIKGGIDLGWVDKIPQAAEIGLMYNRRQKWGIGASLRHNFSGLLPPQNATTLGVDLYIGL